MCPHSVTVKRKSIWLQWAIIGYNRDEADSQERLGDLWTGNVCCSSQHFTANVFSARAASLPQDNLHWCLTSFTQCSFASACTETAVRCRGKLDQQDQPPYRSIHTARQNRPPPPQTSNIIRCEWGISSLSYSDWTFFLVQPNPGNCFLLLLLWYIPPPTP